MAKAATKTTKTKTAEKPANTGTGPLVITQVALLSAPSTEIKRISTIGGESVADNIIHVTITDETADTYTLRGLRLITDGGIIFATIQKQRNADAPKLKEMKKQDVAKFYPVLNDDESILVLVVFS